ncbi:MAG: hypothetical protein ACLRFH_00810 [Opitutales bacterium]
MNEFPDDGDPEVFHIKDGWAFQANFLGNKTTKSEKTTILLL